MNGMEERRAALAPWIRERLEINGDALKERGRNILTRYYGIGRPVETMTSMARDMGISTVRVRELRVEAENLLANLERDPGMLRGTAESRRQKLLERRAKAQKTLDKIDAEIAALYEGNP